MIREIQVGVEYPHLIHLWEPLKTKAPCPDKARPYCCYIRTVIFYVGPCHIVRPWTHIALRKEVALNNGKIIHDYWKEKPGHHYEEWDRAEYALTWDDVFDWCGERFIVGGGKVIWRLSQWWMKHWARRARCKRCEQIIPAGGFSSELCSLNCALVAKKQSV